MPTSRSPSTTGSALMRRSNSRRAISLTSVPDVTVITFEVMMSLAFIAISLWSDAAPARSVSKTKVIQLLHEEKWSQRRLSFVLLNRGAGRACGNGPGSIQYQPAQVPQERGPRLAARDRARDPRGNARPFPGGRAARRQDDARDPGNRPQGAFRRRHPAEVTLQPGRGCERHGACGVPATAHALWGQQMGTDGRKFRIGISGSYGGMNLGDEAILEGILGELRAAVPAEVTVFSMNPSDTLARHRVEDAIAVRSLTRKEIAPAIKQLDLLVLGGGGILFDGEAETYLREVVLAHEMGIPVVLYAISAGPLVTAASRRAVRDALNNAASTVITVRDRLGYRLLEDVGVTQEIHLAADPAFLLEPEELPIAALEAEGVRFDRPVVGFSVREPGPAAPDIDPQQYYALLANAADFVVERFGAEVGFVPMGRADVQHSHGAVARMRYAERAEILKRRYSSRQILDLMGRFDFAVGMRLHFLIFAALRGTPFAPLPYASKVSGLIEDLEMDTPPLDSIGIGQLIGRIDRKWDTRDEIREKIGQRLPHLKQRARQANERLVSLLRQT